MDPNDNQEIERLELESRGLVACSICGKPVSYTVMKARKE